MNDTNNINVLFGIIIPAVVFIFSFSITWLLYRHFAKKQENGITTQKN